jgi:hypothetical protein
VKHLLLLAVVTGCASEVYFTRLNPPPRALRPRPPMTVTLMHYARLVGPVTEVGIIEVRPATYPDRMLEQLRAEAAQIGCDALLLLPGSITMQYGAAVEGPSNRGVCIVYPEALPPAPRSPTRAVTPPEPPPTTAPVQ